MLLNIPGTPGRSPCPHTDTQNNLAQNVSRVEVEKICLRRQHTDKG